MIRGFQEVGNEYKKHDTPTFMPTRGSKDSAGYDFYLKEEVVLKPHDTILTFSDVKAYMQPDEVLTLYPRSSMGIKKKIRITNGTGIIDSDYYHNTETGGNIGIALHNFGNETITLKVGERVCQGIFSKYLIVDDDDVDNIRVGGIGSTNR